MTDIDGYSRFFGYLAERGGQPVNPYPNEHACRLLAPDKFEAGSFRRKTCGRRPAGKCIDVIYGRLKGEDTLTEQAYRYPKSSWDEDQARNHCARNNGSFEAARPAGEIRDNG